MPENNGFINGAYAPSIPSIPGEYNKISGPYEIVTINSNVDQNDVGKPADIENRSSSSAKDTAVIAPKVNRDKWNKDIEFLLSCISLSIGFGNVWRFPYTALQNGGGAFVIPYLIVLVLVGRPIYYMEMVIGQFSSRGCVKVYDFSPIMRGVGYGQVLSTAIVGTYYASLMALTIRYFVASFSTVLPWSYCHQEWEEFCIDSSEKNFTDFDNSTRGKRLSAELYFTETILKEKPQIDDGIGLPNWQLLLCLAFSWCMVALILIKGVRSSGKAAYFISIFPYVVMGILFVRAITLPGAMNGMIYFIKPQWNKLMTPKVWYAAVTQVFFSLTICFGNIIMYSSYNRFSHNVYRDVTIITSVDTLTSLLAGFIIFGILGNLAYETNISDISKVVKAGSGLAFISYPDAIAKFEFLPQLFSVLFFVMLFVLGIGSNVGMASCVMTVIRDRFTTLRHWTVALGISIIGFSIGMVFVTPGGQYILNLVDFYGASFVAFILAIAELFAVGWIYGVKRLCQDIEFMLGIKTGNYWRICWAVISPALMISILAHVILEMEPLKYQDYIYPDNLYVFGWCLAGFGILQLPIWAFYAINNQTGTVWKKIKSAFQPSPDWGPRDEKTLEDYKKFMSERNETMFSRRGFWYKIYDNIFG